MGEGGSRSGVGDVVSWNINSLNGSDGAVFGGGNSFLEGTHFGLKGGLITDGGGKAA